MSEEKPEKNRPARRPRICATCGGVVAKGNDVCPLCFPSPEQTPRSNGENPEALQEPIEVGKAKSVELPNCPKAIPSRRV